MVMEAKPLGPQRGQKAPVNGIKPCEPGGGRTKICCGLKERSDAEVSH
jgi:hypothetical protein